MRQSVDLLLDEDSEQAVVDQWRTLEAAGLASQSRHRGDSNRPHVTLTEVDAITLRVEEEITRACVAALPLDTRLGPLVLLGRGRPVLARQVLAQPAVLEVHRVVSALVGVEADRDSTVAPGRWVPHVTLARRMPLDQLSRAVELLAGDERAVRLVAARRWDGVARRAWRLL